MKSPGFRARIILVFSVITIVVTGFLSRASYLALKDIYEGQLADQMILKTRWIVVQLDLKFLPFIKAGHRNLAVDFYEDFLSGQSRTLEVERAFLFDGRLAIAAATDSAISEYPDPELIFYKEELLAMNAGTSVTSQPFKGKDGQWYMWSFHRLDEQFWLGIQENAKRLSTIENLSVFFWSIAAGGVILTALGGWFIAAAIARPVEGLIRFSRELESGRLDARLPERLTGELQTLATALDQMRQAIFRRQNEKEELLAHIAHEIRNPLGGIELLANLIGEDSSTNVASKNYAHQIVKEVSGLKTLVHHYLEFGKPTLAAPQEIALQSVLEDLRVTFAGALNEKKIAWYASVNADTLWFDPGHLRQVLFNLVANAVQAQPGGGMISFAFEKSGGYRTLAVSDEGPGVPEDVESKLFEPFMTTKQDGFGLGLAICRKLCTENRAEIFFKNKLPKGSVFLIRVPT